MHFVPSYIRRSAKPQRAVSIRPAPAADGDRPSIDLAASHAALIHRRVDRRSQAISLLAFFSAIFTLFWFVLTHQPDGPPAAGGEAGEAGRPDRGTLAAAMPDVPDPAQIDVAPGQVIASGRPAAPDREEYSSFYSGAWDTMAGPESSWQADPQRTGIR